MLKILASTALVSVLTVGAFAQDATTGSAPAEADKAAPEVVESTDTGTVAQEGTGIDEPEPAAGSVPDDGTPTHPPLATREGFDDPGEGFTRVALETISVNQLIDADLRNVEDETVAKITDVLLSEDGKVESIVAQFGGFLGFGENTVLVSMDEIDVLQDQAGNLTVRTNLTPEALEGRPDYQPVEG